MSTDSRVTNGAAIDEAVVFLGHFKDLQDPRQPGKLASLDAEQFQSCFLAWVATVTGVPAGVIAIDGKTARRSGKKGSAKASVHMVSAFAARQRLVLGQVKVAEKTNEIVAIPKLLDMLAIEGAIITIAQRAASATSRMKSWTRGPTMFSP